jgi:superfamily I DNA/RNA helicase/RecB family exonuclease
MIMDGACPVHALVGPTGTGKTTRLLDRTVELVNSQTSGVCLIARDARTASRWRTELFERIGATDRLTVTTFHALALSILRRGWRLLGHAEPPGLLSGPEQFGLVRSLLDSPEEREHWQSFGRARALKGFANELREFILRVQDADESPESISERARLARREDLREAARFFRRYLDVLDDRGMVDHSNAICQATTLLTPDEQDDPNAAEARARLIEQIGEQTSHLLVDDLHSASLAMMNLVRRLAERTASVTVGLDPEAPSFSFRGAASDPLAEFSRRFPDAQIEDLSERLRPTPQVRAVRYLHAADELDGLVAEVSTAHHDGGIELSQIAVIVRRLGQRADDIRRALQRVGIPATIVGENRALHSEPSLRPLLDLVTVATSVADRDEAVPRLLATRLGGFGPVRYRALVHFAKARQTTIDVLFAAPDDDIPEGLRAPLLAIRDLVDRFKAFEAAHPADEAAWWLWEQIQQHHEWVTAGDDHALDVMVAFHNAVSRYSERRPSSKLGEFVEALLAADFGADPMALPPVVTSAVRILTAFAAQGESFRHVFVPGCVDGAYPDLRERTFVLDARDILEPASHAERVRARARSEERLFASIIARATQSATLSYARESADRAVGAVSPIAEKLGIEFAPAAQVPIVAPFTRDAIEALHRRRLLDPEASEVDLKASLSELASLPGVDPKAWWYQRDWTDPGTPLHQSGFKTSQSRFASYEDCGLRYLYDTELGLDQEQSHYMVFGSLVHQIIEEASLKMLEGQPTPTLDELLARLDELWDPSIFDNTAMEHTRKRDAIDCLRRWHETDTQQLPLAVEAEFAFQHGPATVRGKIDRIVRVGSGGTRVTDYKTGRQMKWGDELNNDLQLAVYYLAGLREPALIELGKPMYVELAYLGAWNGKLERKGFQTNDDFEEKVVERLDAIFDGIMQERFAPNPGSDCRNCSYKTLCPLWPEGEEVTL